MHIKSISLAILLTITALQAAPVVGSDNGPAEVWVHMGHVKEYHADDIAVLSQAKTRSQWNPDGLKKREEPVEKVPKTRSQWNPDGLKKREEPVEKIPKTRSQWNPNGST